MKGRICSILCLYVGLIGACASPGTMPVGYNGIVPDESGVVLYRVFYSNGGPEGQFPAIAADEVRRYVDPRNTPSFNSYVRLFESGKGMKNSPFKDTNVIQVAPTGPSRLMSIATVAKLQATRSEPLYYYRGQVDGSRFTIIDTTEYFVDGNLRYSVPVTTVERFITLNMLLPVKSKTIVYGGDIRLSDAMGSATPVCKVELRLSEDEVRTALAEQIGKKSNINNWPIERQALSCPTK